MTVESHIPPQNLDAERAVIGAVLLENDALLRALEHVGPEDFYRPIHRKILEAMVELNSSGEQIDLLTLSKVVGKAAGVGVVELLSEIEGDTPTSANIVSHAKLVRKEKIRRDLLSLSEKITGLVRNGEDIDEIRAIAEQCIFEMSHKKSGGPVILKKIIAENFDDMERAAERQDSITGCPSGFGDLDKKTSGWQSATLSIVAARPSMGKTALSLHIASNAAGNGKTVAFFSLEMSIKQLGLRLIAQESGMDSQNLKCGFIQQAGWARLAKASDYLVDLPIYIDGSPYLRPSDLRSRAKRLATEQDLGLVIIDYLTLLQPDRKHENKSVEVGEICSSLKSLAKELNVPVICLAQLSRKCEDRADKRPGLSDLRDSGQIEQDADLVIFLYRDEYYNPETTDPGIVEVNIAKHRDGPCGTIGLKFEPECSRFSDAPGWTQPTKKTFKGGRGYGYS